MDDLMSLVDEAMLGSMNSLISIVDEAIEEQAIQARMDGLMSLIDEAISEARMRELVSLVDEAIQDTQEGSQQKLQADGMVLNWLAKLEVIDENDQSRATTTEEHEVEIHEERKSNSAPFTPPRLPVQLSELLEGISPTDTSFSCDPVFDSPQRDTFRREDPASPSPARFDDNVSDITSVYSDEEHIQKAKTIDEKHSPGQAALTVDITPPASITSHDPPTEPDLESPTKEPETTKTTTISPPNRPRLIWITSCLQCTLANLPCSRTPPACTRCLHSNTPCLLRRRRTAAEIRSLRNPAETGVPVLLRLPDDTEDIWENKVRRNEELLEAYRDLQDRRNWVMPLPETSPRGGYRYHGVRVGRDWGPGEGIGRARHWEVGEVEEVVV